MWRKILPWIKLPYATMYAHQDQLVIDRNNGPRLVLRPEFVYGLEYDKITDQKTTVWFSTEIVFTLNMSPPAVNEVLRQTGVWNLDELPHDV